MCDNKADCRDESDEVMCNRFFPAAKAETHFPPSLIHLTHDGGYESVKLDSFALCPETHFMCPGLWQCLFYSLFLFLRLLPPPPPFPPPHPPPPLPRLHSISVIFLKSTFQLFTVYFVQLIFYRFIFLFTYVIHLLTD